MKHNLRVGDKVRIKTAKYPDIFGQSFDIIGDVSDRGYAIRLSSGNLSICRWDENELEPYPSIKNISVKPIA